MTPIPYKIAVLAYIFNRAGETLLLHRLRPPNQGLYSPIGGKLEQSLGESPYMCALREIEEEISIRLTLADIRLMGIVSERAHEGQAHWLMFCFEIKRPLDFPGRVIDEGTLEWVKPEAVESLNIPQTDRSVIWPLVRLHSAVLHPQASLEVFSVHIDCTHGSDFKVTPEHPL